MKVSLCTPMYNESSIVRDTVRTLVAYMKSTFEDFEILFVNDGSKDDCAAQAADEIEKLGATDCARVIGYEVNRGKGAALRYAVGQTVGDLVIFTDCDLAYGTEVIGQAAKLFEEKRPELIIGSRRLGEDGYASYTPIRRLASKTYIKLLGTIGGFKLSDSQCGFKCFEGNLGRKIFSVCETDRFAFDFEVLMIATKLKADILEMPVKIINHRESKIHIIRDSVKMFSDMLKIKRRVKRLKIER